MINSDEMKTLLGWQKARDLMAKLRTLGYVAEKRQTTVKRISPNGSGRVNHNRLINHYDIDDCLLLVETDSKEESLLLRLKDTRCQ